MPLPTLTVHQTTGNKLYLFSEEQKNATQGLMLFLSKDGGRYIASEKHVSSSFSSSALMKQTWVNSQLRTFLHLQHILFFLLDVLNHHLFMSWTRLYGGE